MKGSAREAQEASSWLLRSIHFFPSPNKWTLGRLWREWGANGSSGTQAPCPDGTFLIFQLLHLMSVQGVSCLLPLHFYSSGLKAFLSFSIRGLVGPISTLGFVSFSEG